MPSLDHLGEQIAEAVAHHDAALHHILTNLRIFDDGGGYVRQGFRTCAQWLSWRVNWTLNTAREHVRVANALGRLPLIDHALECGQLSYCKVRALTRVATADNEATLLEMAPHMTGEHLERVCRKLAAVKSHDDPTGRSRPTTPDDDIFRRYVHRRDREDGMVVIEAVLHPEEADVVFAALERVAKERCRATSDEDVDAAAPVANAPVAAAPVANAPVANAPVAAAPVANAPLAAAPIASAPVAAAPIASAPVASNGAAAAAISGVAATSSTTRVSAETSGPRGMPVASNAAAAAISGVAATSRVSAEPSRPAPVMARSVRRPTPAFDRATALVEVAQQVLRGTAPDRAPIDIMISIPIETLATSCLSNDKTCCSDSGCTHPSDHRTHPSDHRTHPSDDPLAVAIGGGGTFVSAAAARRLACDAGLIALVEDADGNTLSVGRKTRSVPAATKRALKRRDRTCRFPGCNAQVFLESHHLHHWADGGETSLANLISLCGYHHRFVHEYGFRLEFDPATNTVTAYDATGRRVPGVSQPEPPPDLGWSKILRESKGSITADTQMTWDATPVDYGEIVDVVLRAEARAERAAGADRDDTDAN